MSEHLKILVAVAHPDEAEEYVGGTMALLADAGHHVRVVCTTNGDVGGTHQGPKKLARRRLREAHDAARILGVADYRVWDEHDGDQVDSQRLRRKMLREIRQWRTDLIFTFNDEGPGHNDNRMAAKLVRSVVGLTTLPNTDRRTPELEQVPIVLRLTDYGSIERHSHDVAIDITSVLERKLRACAAHASQFLEFAPEQRGLPVPDLADQAAVDQFILDYWGEYIRTPEEGRQALINAYGPAGAQVEYAETFGLAPYGREVTAEQVQQLLGS